MTSVFGLSSVLLPASTLRPHVKAGVSAVIPKDRVLLSPSVKSLIGDGLNLDAATAAASPNDNRWDYILSVPSKKLLVGVEPHSAGDGEVKVLIKKKANAIDVLRSHLTPGRSVAAWYWVTHGRVAFSQMDKIVRVLNQNGIAFRGRGLKSLD